jgi:ATP-binding cassette subfamily B (MDR/TAP) protein 1
MQAGCSSWTMEADSRPRLDAGLLALLLRFYEPCRGRIQLGASDIRSIPLVQLRQRCAYVSQEPQLFEGTIRWNLCRE